MLSDYKTYILAGGTILDHGNPIEELLALRYPNLRENTIYWQVRSGVAKLGRVATFFPSYKTVYLLQNHGRRFIGDLVQWLMMHRGWTVVFFHHDVPERRIPELDKRAVPQ